MAKEANKSIKPNILTNTIQKTYVCSLKIFMKKVFIGFTVFQIMNPKKLMILVVAYNAEKTIIHLLNRMPADIWKRASEVVIADDASKDFTSIVANEYKCPLFFWYPPHVQDNRLATRSELLY